MNKKWQYIVIVSVLLLAVMWVLNPTSGNFTTYIKKNRQTDPTQKLTKIPGRELAALSIQDQLGKGKLEYDIVKRVVYNYKNFLFFSKATFVEDCDPSYAEVRYFYIGAFEKFMPIGSEITINIPSSFDGYVPHSSDSVVEDAKVWKYEDNVNKQTGGNIHVASIESNDAIKLRSPNSKGSGTLIVRNMKGRSQVFLAIGEHFVTTIPMEGVNVSFDNGKIENWSCDTVGSSVNSVIIILPSLNFIARIKKSKNLEIDAEVNKSGIQQMEFNVTGLVWEQIK